MVRDKAIAIARMTMVVEKPAGFIVSLGRTARIPTNRKSTADRHLSQH
jgi:hypothetical protein